MDARLGGKLPPIGMDVERLGSDEAYTTLRPPYIEPKWRSVISPCGVPQPSLMAVISTRLGNLRLA